MHPPNPYNTPPDFLNLRGATLPSDHTCLHQSYRIKDWRLTEAFFRLDYGILILPDDRLCPPVRLVAAHFYSSHIKCTLGAKQVLSPFRRSMQEV
ncbi:hypothetical protein BDR03DRAFT_264884 [Suillus americanus]|nr:hypothetical protein BDR03DRAFT_264884 [Suillus americanus]